MDTWQGFVEAEVPQSRPYSDTTSGTARGPAQRPYLVRTT